MELGWKSTESLFILTDNLMALSLAVLRVERKPLAHRSLQNQHRCSVLGCPEPDLKRQHPEQARRLHPTVWSLCVMCVFFF